MAEVMLGKELHPDRVIPVEKLYEIFNEQGIPYSFVAQYGIENNSFAVVRCKDCVHFQKNKYADCSGYCNYFGYYDYAPKVNANGYCSEGVRG